MSKWRITYKRIAVRCAEFEAKTEEEAFKKFEKDKYIIDYEDYVDGVDIEKVEKIED